MLTATGAPAETEKGRRLFYVRTARRFSVLQRMPMTRFILFQRDDCHLCDLALDVLAAARLPDFESVFIDDDDALEAAYGTRVPVLRDTDSGVELDWPFDVDRLRSVSG
ncbi:hypothetical protein PAGU2595_019780 [Lysobacter xanthus]